MDLASIRQVRPTVQGPPGLPGDVGEGARGGRHAAAAARRRGGSRTRTQARRGGGRWSAATGPDPAAGSTETSAVGVRFGDLDHREPCEDGDTEEQEPRCRSETVATHLLHLPNSTRCEGDASEHTRTGHRQGSKRMSRLVAAPHTRRSGPRRSGLGGLRLVPLGLRDVGRGHAAALVRRDEARPDDAHEIAPDGPRHTGQQGSEGGQDEDGQQPRPGERSSHADSIARVRAWAPRGRRADPRTPDAS